MPKLKITGTVEGKLGNKASVFLIPKMGTTNLCPTDVAIACQLHSNIHEVCLFSTAALCPDTACSTDNSCQSPWTIGWADTGDFRLKCCHWVEL